jgi:hypothetical protein
MAVAQGVIEGDRLHSMLQSRSHLYPLVSVAQQGSQIPLLGRWHPDLGKAVLHDQQIQHQAGIPPIMFLFPGLGRTDLGRMSYPALDPQFFQQFQKPLHGSGCFDAHHHGTFQGSAKLSYLIPFVEQFLFGELARFRVHHGNRLLLCV